jgi:hypothetical protein
MRSKIIFAGLLCSVVGSIGCGASELVRLNNLKQLSFGMLASTAKNHGKLPAAAIYSKDGRPLLSWRVAILPYVEEQKLYEKFHLDEPWDSPNNKPLIVKMPKVFADPAGDEASEGRTRYLVPTGKGTMFEGQAGIHENEVSDGLQNTLMIVAVASDKAVVWTKPDDLTIDEEKPMLGIGDLPAEGLAAAFGDGAVRVIKKSVDSETLRRLFIRNDGKVVDPAKF